MPAEPGVGLDEESMPLRPGDQPAEARKERSIRAGRGTCIKPLTPRLNEKVERSHHIDNEGSPPARSH